MIPFVLDATLTSIVGLSTKSLGVDVAIYSSTKLLASNGGAVGGIIVDWEILIGVSRPIKK